MQILARVVGNAEVDRFAPRLLHECAQRVAVRIVDLAFAQWSPRFDNLRARHQHAHARTRIHHELRHSHRRRHSQLRRPKQLSRAQHHLILRHVIAGTADVLARLHGFHDGNVAFMVGVRVLLHHHRIRACGNRRASENAHTRLWFQSDMRRRARGRLGDHAQVNRTVLAGAGHVGCPHGVTIHGAVVPQRQIDRGRHVLRQHAIQRFRQWDGARRARPHCRQDDFLRLGNRKHSASPNALHRPGVFRPQSRPRLPAACAPVR